jgi:hypothetical protein
MNRRATSMKTRRPVPVAAALIAGIVLLLAACDSSPPSGSTASPHTGGSTGPTSVAYSACMRAHGVPSYPDPNSSGRLPKTSAQALGVNTAAFQTAQQSRQHLLPSTGGSFQQQFQQCVLAGVCPQALVQEALTTQRKFARCMRSHGMPEFPDPRIGPGGAPYFPASQAGLTYADTHSSKFTSKVAECEHVVGAPVPVLMG